MEENSLFLDILRFFTILGKPKNFPLTFKAHVRAFDEAQYSITQSEEGGYKLRLDAWQVSHHNGDSYGDMQIYLSPEDEVKALTAIVEGLYWEADKKLLDAEAIVLETEAKERRAKVIRSLLNEAENDTSWVSAYFMKTFGCSFEQLRGSTVLLSALGGIPEHPVTFLGLIEEARGSYISAVIQEDGCAMLHRVHPSRLRKVR